ncbi:MAG: hypothetical protein EAZ90_16060 [Oscillatoriales cyanobacterium]|nr:hypothetical protein [Microcoleus sp. PH2017_04_SCI_O_A]TAE42216.1 MAG: hypothetical protein EAZ90_16060 [Oscillatoriales cyanobacterium]TAE64427.1 MAG: hypothetical protein EAZ86_26765 [Oscillatoriales cyanobacterium]TAF39630.1 MAG: hypothetical protein EAZ68_12135 [Oscillatoriales cyanobacterium]
MQTTIEGRSRLLLNLPERIGLKPEPRSGEIKIRLFITPILLLLGRGRSNLSTVNCQLSTE